MPSFYYYDNNNNKLGSFTVEQNKVFVASGFVTLDTVLENEVGKQLQARKIKGLFAEPPSVRLFRCRHLASSDTVDSDIMKMLNEPSSIPTTAASDSFSRKYLA
jgi:hypothetical protein